MISTVRLEVDYEADDNTFTVRLVDDQECATGEFVTTQREELSSQILKGSREMFDLLIFIQDWKLGV